MKSVRIDAKTEEQLQMAAKAEGISESEFIRRAVRKEAGVVLGQTLDKRISDVLGTIRSKGGRATDSGARFTKLVKKESKPRRS